ncbi:MAG: DNA replication and repair protein RecF, partial [Coriobacteriia bacterium]|nr:DNA replication and repair protein RecF [Coriobacteriia bacterium]
KDAHSMIAGGGSIRSVYQASWNRDGLLGGEGIGLDPEEALKRALKLKQGEERFRRMTLVGPHRDDIRFFLDEGRDVRAYSSQGQQRTVALAWKLAEVAVIKDVSGKAPILLLDDVMSELDEQRRSAMARLTGETTQTFVTTTNTGYFEKDLLDRARLIKLGP